MYDTFTKVAYINNILYWDLTATLLQIFVISVVFENEIIMQNKCKVCKKKNLNVNYLRRTSVVYKLEFKIIKGTFRNPTFT